MFNPTMLVSAMENSELAAPFYHEHEADSASFMAELSTTAEIIPFSTHDPEHGRVYDYRQGILQINFEKLTKHTGEGYKVLKMTTTQIQELREEEVQKYLRPLMEKGYLQVKNPDFEAILDAIADPDTIDGLRR